MADELVGPVTPSTHDSAQDKTRPTDVGLLSTLVPKEQGVSLRAKTKLTPMETQALRTAIAGTMFASESMGEDKRTVAARGALAGEAILSGLDEATAAHIQTIPADAAITDVGRSIAAYEAVQEASKQLADDTTFIDQVSAGFAELTVIPQLLRTLEPRREAPPEVKNFDYMEVRDEVEVGLAEEDRQFLRGSDSRGELDWRLNQVIEKRDRLQVMGAHGTGMAIAAGLTGGIVDPAGWVAGFGVGKLAQLAGVGARVALAQGQTARAVGFAAGEGMVGNVLYEATLDAAGGHVTQADYLYAAAFGAAFGQISLLGKKSPAAEAATSRVQAEEVMQEVVRQNHELYAQAQARVEPDASPEEIRAMVDTIQRERITRAHEIALADVPAGDQPLPRFEEKDLPGAEGEPGAPKVAPLDDLLRPVEVRADVEQRWGMGASQVESEADRKLMSETAAWAEDWVARNPQDLIRLDSILAKAPWLASAGLNLARSSNPLARAIAGTLVESTTGGAGARRATAAITREMRLRTYKEPLANYQEHYSAWRNRQGGGHVSDMLSRKRETEFDLLVADERTARLDGQSLTTDANVRQAADALDAGYDLMRQDRVRAGTIGSERLKELESAGYVERRISPAWLYNAPNAHKQALSDAIYRQLEGQWGDKQLARDVSARYLERARTVAYGGTPVPANITSPEASDILKDILRAKGVPEADVELLLGRFSRGGSARTKKRLDLDLSEEVELPDGSLFRLSDAFDKDQRSLYLRYAQTSAGEVALAKFNIMGTQGLALLRKTLQYGPDGQRATRSELDAFDQLAAEFMGTPLPNTGNRYLGALRLLVGSSRLGGMAFTQSVESSNLIGVLGVEGAIKNVRDIPKHIADVRAGRTNPMLESLELVGGPIGQDYRVVFPHQEADDIRIYGRDSVNAVERIIRGGANAVPWLSGWHYVHAAQVRGVADQLVHKALRYVREGGNDAALVDIGLTPDLVARLREQLPNIAEFDEAGTLSKLDLLKTTDDGAVHEFVQSIHRGSKQMIQGTFIGESGKWAHDDLLRLLTQFRSFSITAMEKQWTRQRVTHGTAKAMGLLIGSMAVALPVHIARVQINAVGRENREEYLDQQLDPQMLARAVLNYTALSGLAPDILDAGAALAGFEMSGVRGGGKGVLDNVPALGYVNSSVRAVQEKDVRDLARALPGGNLPYLVPVANTFAE
jgi:hypothetical protein